MAALARELAPKVDADPELAEQAAKLAKCDLVTQTVIEATSLQGQIGRLMYEAEGGNASVATAIEEHYKPQGPSDAVPTDPVAVAVALADKLDTLVGFWAIDEKPTGSKDPFALRRAALGVVRIILEYDVRLKLREALDYGLTSGKERLKVRLGLLSFILDRLKVYLRDQGIRHDIIDAALTEDQDDLVAIVNRVNALQDFLSTPDGENLLAGYKRAANILKAEAKKGDLPEGEANRPTDEHGAALF